MKTQIAIGVLLLIIVAQTLLLIHVRRQRDEVQTMYRNLRDEYINGVPSALRTSGVFINCQLEPGTTWADIAKLLEEAGETQKP